MFKPYFSLLSFFLITNIMISGCANKTSLSTKHALQALSPEQRTAQLLKNKKWQLQGKIAFIEKISDKKDKRESASISWYVDEDAQNQTLNLTSYLGINVLHIESSKGQHVIKVDSKEYRGTHLAYLIYSLTGLTLPTNALTYWLKGLPYQASDKLKLNSNTQLPISISSYYNNVLWQINYSNYQVFDGVKMATKFSIKKNGLLIKVAVKKWSLLSK